MKKMVKFMMIALSILLISSVTYAKKGDAVKNADKQSKATVESASKQTSEATKEVKGKAEKASKNAEATKEAKVKAEKAGKETAVTVTDPNAVGVEKKSWKNMFGLMKGKNHQQQMAALDKQAAKSAAKDSANIAALEKDLAAAKAANDTKKVESLQKKLDLTKQQASKDAAKTAAKRTEIQAEIEKEKQAAGSKAETKTTEKMTKESKVKENKTK